MGRLRSTSENDPRRLVRRLDANTKRLTLEASGNGGDQLSELWETILLAGNAAS